MSDPGQYRTTSHQPLTNAVLERAAATYLERYPSSAENLRRVLMRRVAKAGRDDADRAAEGTALVEALIARYLAAGRLDDGHYAEHRAAGLARHVLKRLDVGRTEQAPRQVEREAG